MTDTKTVELPLTRSEQRHQDNLRRRDKKRARTNTRLEQIAARDEKLKAINNDIGGKIVKLQKQRGEALKVVWDQWREERSKAQA